MARPTKSRKVYSMPNCEGFSPLGYGCESRCNKIIMTVEEYETVRLIDYLGFTQEECADSMDISRPTVTNIYEKARFKLADALVNEKILLIGGGNFNLSDESKKIGKLEVSKMKIAVTFENGEIFQHFGHCENFKIYSVDNNEIVNSEIINTAGNGHGALAGFLKDNGVDTLICGGIGAGAKNALADAGIQLFGGVSGSADAAVAALLNGTLEYNANVQCSHHGHHEGSHTCGHNHGEGHTCGNH